MLEKVKQFLPFAGVVLLGVILLVVCNGITSSYAGNLATMDEKLQNGQSMIDALRVDTAHAESEIKQKLNGLDTQRVEKDKILLSDFLKTVCTWKNLEEYKNVYEHISESYPVDGNERFYKFFVNPESITKDANMTYVNMESQVTGITRDVYSYFVEVSISSTDANQSSDTGVFVFTCDVTNDGALSNLSAYALAQ